MLPFSFTPQINQIQAKGSDHFRLRSGSAPSPPEPEASSLRRPPRSIDCLQKGNLFQMQIAFGSAGTIGPPTAYIQQPPGCCVKHNDPEAECLLLPRQLTVGQCRNLHLKSSCLFGRGFMSVQCKVEWRIRRLRSAAMLQFYWGEWALRFSKHNRVWSDP